jgi:hypothetical protein
MCGITKETNYNEGYPKDWFLVKVFSKPSRLLKGQQGRGYHICKKCKEKYFK